LPPLRLCVILLPARSRAVDFTQRRKGGKDAKKIPKIELRCRGHLQCATYPRI
jgi:hypothetical protein